MGILDDTAIFAAVIQQGGFSHAASHLGLSNGMVSRRIAQLEADLGVTLLKRTTRQIRLTPEGELFWQHAMRIQQEMDAAVSLIQSSAKKPKGIIRLSAPLYFGRHYLTPILIRFLDNFPDIKINLMLGNRQLDPVKEQLDLVIRGSGYIEDEGMRDSTLQVKLLLKEKISLYVGEEYIRKYGEPESASELNEHKIINYVDAGKLTEKEKWKYQIENSIGYVDLESGFNCNDIESGLIACCSGYGIGRFTELNAKALLQAKQIQKILTDYNWGSYYLYAVYPQQKSLPKRTRLLLDFITAHTHNIVDKADNIHVV
ncbi:MAG TPA: LysR family transcriptional regulator [Gammaproteobacteria bacterium]|nr:LysR family transcriptional regulator [Gammaproteobacteria bacterium]